MFSRTTIPCCHFVFVKLIQEVFSRKQTWWAKFMQATSYGTEVIGNWTKRLSLKRQKTTISRILKNCSNFLVHFRVWRAILNKKWLSNVAVQTIFWNLWYRYLLFLDFLEVTPVNFWVFCKLPYPDNLISPITGAGMPIHKNFFFYLAKINKNV